MRTVWLTALLLICASSAGWILVQARPGGMEGALDSALESADLGTGQSGESTAADRAPTLETNEPTFYRYTDAAGSVRFVTSLAEVPPELRDQARPVTQNRVQRAPTSAPAPRAAPPERSQPPRVASADDFELSDDHEVIVYTTSWCGWCRKTLAFLDENEIEYENRDIERDEDWREELIEKTGGTSIPVVEIDGTIVRGYSPKRMRQLLRAS